MPAVDLLGEGTVAAQAAKAHPVMANLDRLEHHRRAAHAAPPYRSGTNPGPRRQNATSFCLAAFWQSLVALRLRVVGLPGFEPGAS